MATDPQIIFTPSGRRGTVPVGTTVLDAARTLGVDIDSIVGTGLAGRVKSSKIVYDQPDVNGTYPSDHLGVMTEIEL